MRGLGQTEELGSLQTSPNFPEGTNSTWEQKRMLVKTCYKQTYQAAFSYTSPVKGLLLAVTEYYTSNAYCSPVQDVADSFRTGAATNVIFGLALGYKYVIIPIFAITVSIFVSHSFAAMYGIAVAALGMLSTIATGLTIYACGPISDNAGGIAEMAGMSSSMHIILHANH